MLAALVSATDPLVDDCPAAAFAALALLCTVPLAPLNKAWLKLGALLYRIVSPVVAMLFYLTVTHAMSRCT